jgi:hypothetical protein
VNLENLGDGEMYDNKIQYSYKCGQISNSDATCNKYYTSPSDGVGKGDSIRYLNNHNVRCPETNEYLTSFKLATGTGESDSFESGKIRYEYTCCPWNENIQV